MITGILGKKTLPLSIEVPSKESEYSHICVLWLSILPLFLHFPIGFW
jgi:hypothetical protein